MATTSADTTYSAGLMLRADLFAQLTTRATTVDTSRAWLVIGPMALGATSIFSTLERLGARGGVVLCLVAGRLDSRGRGGISASFSVGADAPRVN